MKLELSNTIQRLERALAEGLLPAEQTQVATRLLSGLQCPTQVTVFGMPGAGKTSLLNMVLGQPAMPDLPDVSAVELTYGDEAEGIYESQTGLETRFQGIASIETVAPDTLRVVQKLPLERLKNKRLVEINFTEMLGAGSEIVEWATQDSDIAIWCSHGFNDRELSIWSKVPDRLKDNGFLALTHADRLQMQGLLIACVAEFEKQFADEFMGMYPVATKQAIAACANGEVTDEKLWKASGCKALDDELARIISSGKQADADHAEVLLARAGVSYQEPTRAERPLEPSVRDCEPMGHSEAIETALSILQESSEELLTSGAGAHDVMQVLNHCSETSQALSALLMDADEDDTALAHLRDDAIETEQTIQLLSLERTEKAASDAISVLLQLKKEMAEVSSR